MFFKKSFYLTLIAFLFVTIHSSNAADNSDHKPDNLFDQDEKDTPKAENATTNDGKEQFQLNGNVLIRPLSSTYFQSFTGAKQCFFDYRLDNETNTKIYQIQVSIIWEEGLNLNLRFFKSRPGEKETTSLATTGDSCEINTAILPKVEITKCKMKGVKDEETCKKAVKINWRPAPFSN